jgi:predicted regulator of Ras-like GTPase activity (Roadblock/LC7/MglB family)
VDAAETLAQSLERLRTLSSDIKRAAIVDRDGAVLAATSTADGERLASAASELLDAAPPASAAATHVEVGLAVGSVFAVRDNGQVAVATTGPEPASALVLHDLRTLLHQFLRETADA